MSTEKIDHVAKALDHLEGWDTEGHWEGEVASAQVHATLALVEQQRIGNLISIAMWNSRALVEGARLVGDEPFAYEDEVARVDAIFAEVQKGLKIR